MSDFDLQRDDEIVSAYLDGEATAEERARVENDPRLGARLRELEIVARAVGTPHFFADAPGRDRLVATALLADERPDDADVVSLDQARARRRTQRRVLTIAAAGVVAMLLAVPLVSGLGGDDSDMQTATVAADSEADSLDQLEELLDESEFAGPGEDSTGAEQRDLDAQIEGGEEPDAVPVSPTTVEPADTNTGVIVLEPRDLGSFATRADAGVAVTAEVEFVLLAGDLARDAGAPGDILSFAADASGADCDAAIIAGDSELGRLVYSATFTIPEGERQVFLYELAATGAVNGTHRLYEVTRPACAIVTVQTLG